MKITNPTHQNKYNSFCTSFTVIYWIDACSGENNTEVKFHNESIEKGIIVS